MSDARLRVTASTSLFLWLWSHREMDGMKMLDRFQLYDHAAVDHQVQFEPAIDTLPLVVQRNMLLAVETKVFSTHFDDQAFPIHGLQ